MKLNKTIIKHIIAYIQARHFNYLREAVEHKTWLEKHLGDNFSPVLLKHGDPDRGGNLTYQIVMDKWEAELISLDGKDAENFTRYVLRRVSENPGHRVADLFTEADLKKLEIVVDKF